jgi:two-component system sensor histidine kinase QseC
LEVEKNWANDACFWLPGSPAVKSIRVFLVTVILAIITLFSFVAALKGYQSSMAEADRLFDKQLLDTARLIAYVYTQSTISNEGDDSTFTFQVWQQDQLLASSFNAPSTLIAPLTSGFDHNNFDGYRWRTVAHFDIINQYWVVAAERSDLRYALAENVALESIAPVLLGLPLVGLLIWLIVGQGLKPLRRLADELGNKRPEDLSPLSYDSSSQELQRIVLSSNKLLGRLERSLLREQQFASDAAHELRTPISVLKVQLHNLSEELPDNNQNIRELAVTTERLRHIVEQILDLYRSSPDQYNASLKSIDLNDLVQEVLAQEYPSFEAKNQTLEFQGEECFIQGDRFALSTLLLNLLSNANKYTPLEGQISVSTRQSAGHVILTIEDSGSGIPEQQREAVFERFHRVGGDRHPTGVPGCGLGLAIVKHIVESHNASISISDSRFETGIAFQIKFSRSIRQAAG